MKKMQKWNYETKSYEPYKVPKNWKCKTFSIDMDEIINCPHCGKKFKFGDGYTSHEIHTQYGMGYVVCETCYFLDENTRYYKDKGIDYNSEQWF